VTRDGLVSHPAGLSGRFPEIGNHFRFALASPPARLLWRGWAGGMGPLFPMLAGVARHRSDGRSAGSKW